jgi:hypothetical protein
VRPVVFHSTSARAKSALGALGVEESSYECLITSSRCRLGQKHGITTAETD